MEQYKSLSFDDLRSLHRDIGALIAERRHEALAQLKEQIAVLGFSIDDLGIRKRKERTDATAKYRDPEHHEQIWSGRGKHPAWLRDKLEQGRTLEEFLI